MRVFANTNVYTDQNKYCLIIIIIPQKAVYTMINICHMYSMIDDVI